MSVRSSIRSFLTDPKQFAVAAGDSDVWTEGLEAFAIPTLSAANEHALRPAQERAWRGLAPIRAGLVLGPPGTGKTHLLSWLILGYMHARASRGLATRVFISGFTRNAIGNVVDAVSEKGDRHWPGQVTVHFFGAAPQGGLSPMVAHRERVSGASARAALEDLQRERVVAGGSIWSLYHLLDSGRGPGADGLTAELFDLVCLDEASQMVLTHGLMALGGLRPEGRLVVSGDDRQLPPIRAARERCCAVFFGIWSRQVAAPGKASTGAPSSASEPAPA